MIACKDMSTAEFVETILEKKLSNYQKAYMDYLDRNFDKATITIPRPSGFISAYDLWVLGRVNQIVWIELDRINDEMMKEIKKENLYDRNN